MGKYYLMGVPDGEIKGNRIVELTEEDIKRILNSFPRPTTEEMGNGELGAKIINEYNEQILNKIRKVLE